MTVKEIIDFLSNCPPDAEVKVHADNDSRILISDIDCINYHVNKENATVEIWIF